MKKSLLGLVTLLAILLQVISGLTGGNCPAKCICNPRRKHVTCDGRYHEKPLREIPPDIPTDTQYLVLDNSELKILRENSFANLTQLKFLFLRNSSISFIEENAFFGLTNIQTIDLSANNLRYLNNTFTGTFNGAENLKKLSLERTSLTRIPDQVLTKLKKLSVLDLDRNLITNSTLGEGFRNLRELKQMSICQNNLSSLTNNSFLMIRYLKLKQFHLLRSNISHIEVGTFAGLAHLEQLDLSENSLYMTKKSIDLMLQQLCQAPIRRLGFSRTNLKNITGTFLCFRQLTGLDISGNKFHTVEDNTFISQTRLVILNMMKNLKLTSFQPKALQGLTTLRVLLLNKCNILHLPIFADEKGNSFLPKIQSMDLTFNHITALDKVHQRSPFSGLEQLKSLNLSHNSLQELSDDLLQPLLQIKFLHFDNNGIKNIGKRTFSGLKNIKSLTLSENPWKAKQVCYFANLRSLEHLILHGVYLRILNYFTHDGHFKPECMFEGLVKLKVLDLSYTNLKGLPERLFKDLTSLERLILRQNQLSGWNDVVLENLKNLRSLDVSMNQIRTINQSSLRPVLSTLNHFQAFSNPYICDCNLAWYVDWVRQMHDNKTFTLKISYKIPYKCSNLKHKSLLQYRPTFFECHHLLVILCGSGFGLFIVILAVIGLLYKHRWYIRYWIFLLRSRRSNHLEETDRLLYTYDCFITYSGDDSDLVTQQLLPKLENEFGYKMCIHERDFKLGRDISENIAESIEKSRKVLVVLTQNFVKSEWCKFEVNLAHANALHNAQKARQSLIIILVEDVSFEHMTPILRFLMRKKTFLEWSDDTQGQRLFWDRLKDAIQQHGQAPSLDED